MFKKERVSLCMFYAVSPIHAGSGAALAAVDLPIQRERHTKWPHIQAPGVKGAMRAHYRDFAMDKSLINFLFGYDKADEKQHIEYNKGKAEKDQFNEKDNFPGAVSFSDAKLLFFPVRSNIAPFVWITCPAVLKRLANDLEFAGMLTIGTVPSLIGEDAMSLRGDVAGNVILEDMVVTTRPEGTPAMDILTGFSSSVDKLLLVSDEVFKYAVESCTEIQTQIKIDSEKGTAADTGPRYQELLPADSVLYSVVHYSRSVFDNELKANTVRNHIEDTIKDFMQIGGDETLGRGICKINWIPGGSL